MQYNNDAEGKLTKQPNIEAICWMHGMNEDSSNVWKQLLAHVETHEESHEEAHKGHMKRLNPRIGTPRHERGEKNREENILGLIDLPHIN